MKIKPATSWHSSAWKWALFLALIVCSAFLLNWKRPVPRVKVELLPLQDSQPTWDGSVPYLVISAVPRNPSTFKSSLLLLPPTVRHDSPVNDFLVNLQSGRFVLRQTDLFVADVMPLSLTRTYIVWDYHSRAFGVGGNHPYDICPTGTRNPYTYMELNLEGDQSVYLRRISKGTGYADAVFRHDATSSDFYGMQIAWNGNGWTLDFRDGRRFLFPEAYFAKNFAQGAATEMMDANGNRIQLKRSKVRNLEELISPSGHTVTFKYDSADRIVEAQDSDGHIRKYSYGPTGHLQTVSDQSRILYRFEYESLLKDAGYDPWLLTAVLDGNWNVLLRNKYLWGRVSEQRLSDGQLFRYDYQFKGGEVLRSTVVLPSGDKRVFWFRNGVPIQ